MKKTYYILLLIIVGFLVYSNTFANNFLWDDEIYFVNNQQTHDLKNIPNFFLSKTPIVGSNNKLLANLYRPGAFFIYTIFYNISNSTPLFFHLFQILLHISNSILLFLILKFFWDNLGLSFILALIFLVHPINSEAVNFMSAILEPAYVFLGLSGLYLLFKHQVDNKYIIYLPGFLFLFSSLVKESGLLFFPIASLLIFLLFKKNRKLSLIAVNFYFVFYILLRFFIAQSIPQRGQALPIMQAELFQRILTIPKIIYFYFSTLLFPRDLSISRNWVVTEVDMSNFLLPLLISTALFISLIYLTIKLKNIKFTFFFSMFVGSFIIYFQIVPLTMTVAERWFYLPFIAILGMSGILAKTKLLKNIFMIILIIATPFLILRTIVRNSNWINGLTLFSHDEDIDIHAYDFENNLGVELIRIGYPEKAKPHFEKSIEMAPVWWQHYNNLGVVYQFEGNFRKAEELFLKSIKNGEYELAYENYIQLLINEKKYDQAKKYLNNEALKKYPKNSKLHQFRVYLSTI